MGAPAGYWRAWRAQHPEYVEREHRRMAARRRAMTPEQRRRDRGVRRRAPAPEPLPLLHPELQHGSAISFWEDELRLDLAQESALALLEGRNPEEAVAAYRAREVAWRRITAPLIEHLEGSGGKSSVAR